MVPRDWRALPSIANIRTKDSPTIARIGTNKRGLRYKDHHARRPTVRHIDFGLLAVQLVLCQLKCSFHTDVPLHRISIELVATRVFRLVLFSLNLHQCLSADLR